MKINHNVSYWKSIPIQGEFAILSHTERTILYNVISQLSDNSTVVEIGSALGGSACVMAAANPTINIVCIEPFYNNISCWDDQTRPHLAEHLKQWSVYHNISEENYLFLIDPIISYIDLCFKEDPSGASAFNFITKSFPNIKLLQGASPSVCADWSTPIDVYFEDAEHSNPVLHSNIDFWIKYIKPNGFIIGHDYNNLCPDVVSEFNALIGQGWNIISKVESLIILQKPNVTEGNN
jgi:hypothetical protein